MTMQTSPQRVEFISIKDAALRYQKAEITIRRFVRSVLAKEKSAERALVYPLPQDAVKMKKLRKPFVYKIHSELLEKQYGALRDAPRASSGSAMSYVQLLEKTNTSFEEQLKVKDEQIRVLAQAIDDLSERQRETNILMKGLQERLLLPAPDHDVVESVHVQSPASAKKSGKKRRGWWKLW